MDPDGPLRRLPPSAATSARPRLLAARPPDGHLRRQRPAGPRRAGGRRELGLRVPDDLSLVGYDDIPSPAGSARLTTVRQPLRRMAEEATKLVIRLADEHDGADAAGGRNGAPTPRMDLATSLVVRESTAPPPAG